MSSLNASFLMWFLNIFEYSGIFCNITCMLGILEKTSPSELVSNGYISNHNRCAPTPKFQSLLFYIFLLFLNQCYSNKLWKHQKKIQRIISDNCFQLKSRFNVGARAPSIPLLNSHLISCTQDICHGWAVDYMYMYNSKPSIVVYPTTFHNHAQTQVLAINYCHAVQSLYLTISRQNAIHLKRLLICVTAPFRHSSQHFLSLISIAFDMNTPTGDG